MTADEFIRLLKSTRNLKKRSFFTLLYYYCPRVSEAINLKKKQFWTDSNYLVVDIGRRLKGSKTTEPLMVPIDRVGIANLRRYIDMLPRKESIAFDVHRVTAWRWCHKFNIYPHYFILSRITKFLTAPGGKGISAAQNWTGKSIRTLQNYAGQVSIKSLADDVE